MISAELERELFRRFWLWLKLVGVMVVVVTSAAWAIIYSAITPQAEKAARAAAAREIATFKLDEIVSGVEKRVATLTTSADKDIEGLKTNFQTLISAALDASRKVAKAQGEAERNATLAADQAKETARASEEAVINSRKAVKQFQGANEVLVGAQNEYQNAKNAALSAVSQARTADDATKDALEHARKAKNALKAMEEQLSESRKVQAALANLKVSVDEIANDPDFRMAVTAEILSAFRGAVVAFSEPQSESRVCPFGWSLHEESYAKTIVGAVPKGRDGQIDAQIVDVEKYRLGKSHGEEETTLSEQHMPSHDHVTRADARLVVANGFDTNGGPLLNDSSKRKPNLSDTVRLSSAGGINGDTQAHNNMPPYIALYFCKKD